MIFGPKFIAVMLILSGVSSSVAQQSPTGQERAQGNPSNATASDISIPWLNARAYQQVFDDMVERRRFPRVIEAQVVNNEMMFRATYEPYPSAGFGFYGHHGISRAEFLSKDRLYQDQGFVLIHLQSVNDGAREYIQAVWVRPAQY